MEKKIEIDGKDVVFAMDELEVKCIRSKNIGLIRIENLIIGYIAVNPSSDPFTSIEEIMEPAPDFFSNQEWEQVFSIDTSNNFHSIKIGDDFLGSSSIHKYLNENLPKLISSGIKQRDDRIQNEKEESVRIRKEREEKIASISEKYKQINRLS